MKLLIDGYNLIPALPDLGRILRKDLEAGREALLRLLRDYRRSTAEPPSITVVFDGKGHARDTKSTPSGGIEVMFSRDETADDLLLRLLRGQKRGAVLVTSDRALGAAAGEFASAVVRSGEFAGRLLQARQTEAAAPAGKVGEEAPPRRHRSTKKRGNPRRLPKKERLRRRYLKKL